MKFLTIANSESFIGVPLLLTVEKKLQQDRLDHILDMPLVTDGELLRRKFIYRN